MPEGIEIDVEPGHARPGQTVTVTGRCDRAGDEGMRIVSRALSAESVRLDSDGRFSIPATVRRAGPGTHTVTVICEPSKTSATGRFRVAGRFRGHDGDRHDGGYPRGGAGTGGGGTAREARDDRSSAGPALALALAVAGGIGGVALVRRRVRA
jgi:hypothetical protein